MNRKNKDRRTIERFWLLGIKHLDIQAHRRRLLPSRRSMLIGSVAFFALSAAMYAAGSLWATNNEQLFVPAVANFAEIERAESGSIASAQDTEASGGRYVQLVGETNESSAPVLAAVGDIACGPTNVTQPCRHEDVASSIAASHPDIFVPLGDIQYQTGLYRDFLNFYDKSFGQFRAITRPVVGNHEYESSLSAAGYFDYFNGLGIADGPAGNRQGGYYSFNLGSWHIITLNSNCYVVSCAVGSPQAQWLIRDLQENAGAACTMAMWHHPRYTSGYDSVHGNRFKDLYQILYDHQVDILLAGHSHNYERFDLQDNAGRVDPNGIRQFVVGTGGKDFTDIGTIMGNSQARQNTTFGFLKLTLSEKSYDWEFVPISGRTFTDFGYNHPCHKG
jgi:hypothetical protein